MVRRVHIVVNKIESFDIQPVSYDFLPVFFTKAAEVFRHDHCSAHFADLNDGSVQPLTPDPGIDLADVDVKQFGQPSLRQAVSPERRTEIESSQQPIDRSFRASHLLGRFSNAACDAQNADRPAVGAR